MDGKVYAYLNWFSSCRVYRIGGIAMKPMEAWEMESVFIFSWIVILLVAGVIVFLAAKAVQISHQKQEEQKEDPCDRCLRWPECNGVDEDCPIKKNRLPRRR